MHQSLAHILLGLEREQAEQTQRLNEARRRLPGYEQRLGSVFEFADELEAKRSEMAEIEASLAQTPKGEAA